MQKLPFMFAMVLLVVACARLQVTSDWNPSVDFNQLQSYVILPNETPGLSPFTRQRIEQAIMQELQAKGLRKVSDGENADMAVGFEIASDSRTSYHTVHNSFASHGFRSHPSRWGMGLATTTSRTTQHTYTVGTLLIAVFETDNKELIWEASASGNINASSGQNQEKISSAVQSVLRDFPPPRP